MLKRPIFSLRLAPAALTAALSLAACAEPSEAPRVQAAVLPDADMLAPAATNTGWSVRLERVQIAARALEFTIRGEEHSALDWLVPSAYAHPGHTQGGEVTGVMPGAFVLTYPAPQPATQLGEATLIAGDYEGANFTFSQLTAADVMAGDPAGHTAILVGTATREQESVPFTMLLDAPGDRQLIGAPFRQSVQSGAQELRLALRFSPTDRFEGKTIFDDIDFAALASPDQPVILSSEGEPEVVEAYNLIRRRFLTSDYFDVLTLSP